MTSYQEWIERAADEVRGLSDGTKSLVYDALRVRAMDFVQERLMRDSGAPDVPADASADVYRLLVPDADAIGSFKPTKYAWEREGSG